MQHPLALWKSGTAGEFLLNDVLERLPKDEPRRQQTFCKRQASAISGLGLFQTASFGVHDEPVGTVGCAPFGLFTLVLVVVLHMCCGHTVRHVPSW